MTRAVGEHGDLPIPFHYNRPMFIGHIGLAFAAKRWARETSLGTLIAAAEFLDFIWPVPVLTGREHFRIVSGITAINAFDFYDYPISHSLLTSIMWGTAFSLVYWLIRSRGRAALVLGALTVSHWVLDFVSHRPDMPLAPWSSFVVGLGLWNHRELTIVVEVALFAGCVLTYVKATRAKDRIGLFALWSLISALLVLYLGSIFGPPPANVRQVAWGAMGVWLFVLWSWWADAHRSFSYERSRVVARATN
jgi:hypothetical protein